MSTSFNESKLFASDFDDNYALTSEPSPKGLAVARAYSTAIETVFDKNALDTYNAAGGLLNRSPSEIVSQVAPDISSTVQSQKAEDLIRVKLGLLWGEVSEKLPDGSIWPRIAPGFTRLWERVNLADDITTAVVSSGHRTFIERFHEVHELPEPDFLLTDDDMRPLRIHMPQSLTVKPSGLLLEITHRDWMERNEISADTPLAESKARIVYAGDDHNKDGVMAENYGVCFVHINRYNPIPEFQNISRLLLSQELGMTA